MNNNPIDSVSIAIGSSMYGRFEDLPNTPSHVLAEFVDNALQSSIDKRSDLLAIEPDYKLRVTIDIDWEDIGESRARTITVRDNAGGIAYDKYLAAFEPAKTPENNTGLNEFGMGLKTAACWLGEKWSVQTKAIHEEEERTLSFELSSVVKEELRTLPVRRVQKDSREHYTIISITNPTKNVPAIRSLGRIKEELASIYRKSLRNNEMELVVCGQPLTYFEPKILCAPFARTPEAEPVFWKKDIDFAFGPYKAKGFIGILRDINQLHNGFVLLRRGRVVMGAETDGRYFPKCLCGSVGTFRYKRIFGELELDGFEVSFNKNDIQDKENLEALMEALKSEIHTKSFDLYTQAEEYRLDETVKMVKKLVKKHNSSPKTDRQPVAIDTTLFAETKAVDSLATVTPVTPAISVIDEYEDKYNINGVSYSLSVQFVTSAPDLFWVDVSQLADNVIKCQINADHVFFKHFGKPTEPVIAMLKSFAIAKFTAKIKGNDTASEMIEYFNEFIKKTKV